MSGVSYASAIAITIQSVKLTDSATPANFLRAVLCGRLAGSLKTRKGGVNSEAAASAVS